jgi:hypothetical protein
MKWWQIRKRDADLERELRSDLELEEEELQEGGLSPEEASRAARRAFGNPVLIREQTHEAWGWASLERLCQDLLYSIRSARRAPLISVIAVAALSLGIGLNAGVFTLLNAIFLNPPTQTDPSPFRPDLSAIRRLVHGSRAILLVHHGRL